MVVMEMGLGVMGLGLRLVIDEVEALLDNNEASCLFLRILVLILPLFILILIPINKDSLLFQALVLLIPLLRGSRSLGSRPTITPIPLDSSRLPQMDRVRVNLEIVSSCKDSSAELTDELVACVEVQVLTQVPFGSVCLRAALVGTDEGAVLGRKVLALVVP
jgi:hypothetical protein